MTDELKPCPFCGSTRIDIDYIEFGYRALCTNCGTVGMEHKSESKTIQEWNTRPIEDAQAARIAELESIVSDFLDCPMILDQATVPMAGIDTAPNQVVFNFCCSYTKILAARRALERGKP